MHARNQLELISWVVVHSPEVIDAIGQADQGAMDVYWTTSKIRLTRWNTALKAFEPDLTQLSSVYNPWPALETIMEEVVVAESVTRIWSAIVVSADHKAGRSEFAPLVHSVFLSHLETKNRVLRMLLHCRGTNELLFDRINRLRRSVEKWTDLFLTLVPDADVPRRFAFDPTRNGDFDVGHANNLSQREQQSKIWLNSAELVFQSLCQKWAANPELNRRIADGILFCIPVETFDVLQMPTSVAAIWRERSQAETQILFERLTNLEA